MIPLGAIEFRLHQGSGPNKGHYILIGELTLGQSRAIGFDEHRMRGIPKKELFRQERNLIRREIHHKCYEGLLKELYKARYVALSSISNASDYQRIVDTFEKLDEFIAFKPVSEEPPPPTPIKP